MTMNLGLCQTELPWGDGGTATGPDVIQICNEIAALGAKAIRMSALWGQIDPNKNGKYQWANLDRAMDAATGAGLDVLLICETRRSSWLDLAGVPVGISATASNIKLYGAMCGAIAQRYGDRIKWFEIGNEMNSLTNFASPKDPSKYLDLLASAYDQIKPNAPDSFVLAGALMAVATGQAFGLVAATMNPVEWVQAFYNSNPQGSFDMLSMHNYSTGGVFDPMIPTADNQYAFKNITLIRAIMDANGDGPSGNNKLILCSEWGFDSNRSLNGLSTTPAEVEAEQALYIQTQWELMQPYADAGIISPDTFLYNYRDEKAGDTDAAYSYGQKRFDYSAKAAWFFDRSLGIDPDIAAPVAASVTAQAWAPTIARFIDMSHPVALVAAVTAQAWVPANINIPIVPVASAVTAQAWAPMIEVLSPDAAWVSNGDGARVNGSANSASIDWPQDVTDLSGRLLLVALVVSTPTDRDWSNYVPVVTSDLSVLPFVRLGSRHIASASVKHGSVHIYGLYHPAVGTHTITAAIADSDGAITFTNFAGDSVFVRGASGFGTLVAAGSSSGGNTASITIASLLDHYVFSMFGTSLTIPHLTGTVRYSDGAAVTGQGDYIYMVDAPGDASVTFADTVSSLRLFGALALDVPNITALQRSLTVDSVAVVTAQAWAPTVVSDAAVMPAASASAMALVPRIGLRVAAPVAAVTVQAWVPVIGSTAGEVSPSVGAASAQAWVPLVGRRVSPPLATVTAQAWAPSVVRATLPPAATATAQAWAPTVSTSTGVVAFDSAGAGNRATSVGAPSLSTSWSHTVVASGPETVAVAAVELYRGVGGSLTTTVTYGGVAMALVDIEETAGSISTAFYELFNPPTGAQTVTATGHAPGDVYLIQGASVAYTGAASISAAVHLVSTSSTTPAITIPSAAGSMCVAAIDRERASTTTSITPTGTSRYSAGGSVTKSGVTAYVFLNIQDGVGATSTTLGATAGTGTSRGLGISINPT